MSLTSEKILIIINNSHVAHYGKTISMFRKIVNTAKICAFTEYQLLRFYSKSLYDNETSDSYELHYSFGERPTRVESVFYKNCEELLKYNFIKEFRTNETVGKISLKKDFFQYFLVKKCESIRFMLFIFKYLKCHKNAQFKILEYVLTF